jgi:hypothetical protein
MKTFARISMVALMLLLFAGGALAAEKITGPYNPAIQYTGEHPTDVILYKNPKSDMWQLVPKVDRLSRVKCSEALYQLNREGKWQGRLKQDGSCGSFAEPVDWITGNRLNYEGLMQDQR